MLFIDSALSVIFCHAAASITTNSALPLTVDRQNQGLPVFRMRFISPEEFRLKICVVSVTDRLSQHQRSEKLNADIEQLELRLEDLEASQAAAEPLPPLPAAVAINEKAVREPARRPLPAELARETETIAPIQEACPDCGGKLRLPGEDVSETLEYVPARFKK